ncbi:DUF2383 domain-containing protein [Alkalihalobacillus sp. 1P02AB]|uniref:DUF2383 domain-containing protein n=1 Tax=Alkalihalobacillus sp. 1P02AB TaxID=3132260 RepID=UPI0039A5456D
MEKKAEVKILNDFLQGNYMGIHSYEHLIEKIESPTLKDSFIKIQKDLKTHAAIISERIQRLNGTPVTSEGLIGKVESFVGNLFESYKTDEDIIKHAIKGENIYGIRNSEKLVRDKLGDENLQLVHQILEKDREHIDYLKSLLHS